MKLDYNYMYTLHVYMSPCSHNLHDDLIGELVKTKTATNFRSWN